MKAQLTYKQEDAVNILRGDRGTTGKVVYSACKYYIETKHNSIPVHAGTVRALIKKKVLKKQGDSYVYSHQL